MKKRGRHLVDQHLEGISRIALENYQQIIREYVRERHGVYALYKNNRLNYVGLATDLRRRLRHHLHDRHAHTWDRFSVYLTVSDKHLHELESLVIRIASPKGNRIMGKFPRSEDLKNEFRKAIKQFQRAMLKPLVEKQGLQPRKALQRKRPSSVHDSMTSS